MARRRACSPRGPPSPGTCTYGRTDRGDCRAATAPSGHHIGDLPGCRCARRTVTGSSLASSSVVLAPRQSKPSKQLPRIARSRDTGVNASPMDETLSAVIGSEAVLLRPRESCPVSAATRPRCPARPSPAEAVRHRTRAAPCPAWCPRPRARSPYNLWCRRLFPGDSSERCFLRLPGWHNRGVPSPRPYCLPPTRSNRRDTDGTRSPQSRRP